MSKRRINKQQTARIKKIQTGYQQVNSTHTKEGLVLTRFGRHAEIEDQEGKRIHCSIRPNLDFLVAGDRVVWQPESEEQGVVVSLYPRHSVLGRPDKSGKIRPIAANITQIIVVIAVKPEVSWFLLDSYLVMVAYLGLDVCIVLNKVDLPCVELQHQLEQCYLPLGYRLLFTAKHPEQGYDLLKEVLNHQTSVFVGQSGVGKSSLISKILPHESNIQTAAISAQAELGCHTTSNSRFYHLPSGGALIDSPGIRELGLWHISPEDIFRGFPEFRPYLSQCQFRNCNHIDDLGCAILQGLSDGNIAKTRYDSFLKMKKSLA